MKTLGIIFLVGFSLFFGSCVSMDMGAMVEAGKKADADYQAAGNRLPESSLKEIVYIAEKNFFTNFNITDKDYIVKIEFKSFDPSLYLIDDETKTQYKGQGTVWKLPSPKLQLRVKLNTQAAPADLETRPVVLTITDNKGNANDLTISFKKR